MPSRAPSVAVFVGTVSVAILFPALGASAQGSPVGVLWAVSVADNLYDWDDNFALLIASSAAIQAGVTTLIASAFD